jgi:hypothetical protein
MAAEVFEVTGDFRAWMQQVVAYLDVPADNKLLDAPDALRDECGYGGRIDGVDTYEFTYLQHDGHAKWVLRMKEAAIRNIADGFLDEIMGERHELPSQSSERIPKGYPLLIWGEYGDDALCPRDGEQVVLALDSLHSSAGEQPRMLRMWTSCDDQLIAVVWGDFCAIYVIESPEGYATSRTDHSTTGVFEVNDHDGKPMSIPFADCVPWEIAKRGLVNFVASGELGAEIKVDGVIPTVLLVLGEVDRQTVLAQRQEPPRVLERSSLANARMPATPQAESVPEEIAERENTQPVTVDQVQSVREVTTKQPVRRDTPLPISVGDQLAWARRLIDHLQSRELLEINGASNVDEIGYQLCGLLEAHWAEAEHSLETANWLCNEIGAVRGVKMYATGGDLQIALRRSREA